MLNFAPCIKLPDLRRQSVHSLKVSYHVLASERIEGKDGGSMGAVGAILAVGWPVGQEWQYTNQGNK